MKMKVITILLILIIFVVPLATSYAKTKPIQTNQDKPTETKINRDKPTEKWITAPVFASGEFKSYMDGSMITDTTSSAYAQKAKMMVNSNGLYAEDKYIGIAMARFYGEVGDKFRITLSSGQVFYGVLTDTKQEEHIGEDLADLVNGSVIEFIVDTESLSEEVKLTGSLNCIYKGSIQKMEKRI